MSPHTFNDRSSVTQHGLHNVCPDFLWLTAITASVALDVCGAATTLMNGDHVDKKWSPSKMWVPHHPTTPCQKLFSLSCELLQAGMQVFLQCIASSRRASVLTTFATVEKHLAVMVRRQSLLDKLAAGTTLVVDRYAYSGIAYSSAKGKDTMSLEVRDLRDIEHGQNVRKALVLTHHTLWADPSLCQPRLCQSNMGKQGTEKADVMHMQALDSGLRASKRIQASPWPHIWYFSTSTLLS
eukprot:571210-Pelagomonas_calceolata.AAC.3